MASLPYVDHTAAVVGALAATPAVLHRRRTGEAIHLSTSLSAAAVYAQAPELARFPGHEPGRSGGRDFAGPGPLDRIHPVANGFVRIQADTLDAAAWRAAGLPVDDGLAARDPVAAIADALTGRTRAEAVAALTAAGVRAAVVRRISEIVNDSGHHASGLLDRYDARGGVRFGRPGRVAGFSRTPAGPPGPAPGLGEHTRELLAEAGYPPEDVARLEADGEVASGAALDVVYLPPTGRPTPETQPYWDGAARGQLVVQRCVQTGRCFLYPRATSPFVTGGAVEWVPASGRATLYSYTIVHRPAPGFADIAPYALAVVELEEGARLMTNIVGVPNTPEHLVLDMPLQVRFVEREGVALPVFEPAVAACGRVRSRWSVPRRPSGSGWCRTCPGLASPSRPP